MLCLTLGWDNRTQCIMCCHLRFFSNLQASNYQSDDVSLLVKNRQFFKCNNKKQRIALTTTATSQKTHYHPQTTMTTTSSMYHCVRSQKKFIFKCDNKKQRIALTTTATSQKARYHSQMTMITTLSMYRCVCSQKNLDFSSATTRNNIWCWPPTATSRKTRYRLKRQQQWLGQHRCLFPP